MTPTSVQSAPPFPVPVKASERIAAMMDAEHVTPGHLTKIFLQHLATIEEIEAKLGREDMDKVEMEKLVRLCHQILNEVQELHINAYVENAYIHHKENKES
jgi:hypothetical protein